MVSNFFGIRAMPLWYPAIGTSWSTQLTHLDTLTYAFNMGQTPTILSPGKWVETGNAGPRTPLLGPPSIARMGMYLDSRNRMRCRSRCGVNERQAIISERSIAACAH